MIGLSTGLFLGAAKIGGAAFVGAQNSRQLDDLAQLVLRRAELEVDFALVALSELAQKGVADCSPASLAVMRRQVYEKSTIKDIRIVDQRRAHQVLGVLRDARVRHASDGGDRGLPVAQFRR